MADAAAVLEIDLAAIAANWLSLAQRVAPATCAAVVKADAYGLGAAPVARALYAAGCRQFFVALVDEGVALRPTLAADATVYVLHGPLPGAEADCLEHRLVPVLNSLDQVERWQALARERGEKLAAALQFDTGMARLGLAESELGWLVEQPARLEGIDLRLGLSHLVSAEESDNPLNREQWQRFAQRHARLAPCAASLANSSGIFLGRDFHFDLVRPGAALYGIAPVRGAPNPMRGVIRLQARLLQWRELGCGEGVGYNHAWRSPGPARIATVSIGYADGYLRSLGNRGRLRLESHELPVVGRVSMDTITVDASAVPPALLLPGTLLEVIGAGHDINAVAAEAGTNAYEILTQLGPRYQRLYLDGPPPHGTPSP